MIPAASSPSGTPGGRPPAAPDTGAAAALAFDDLVARDDRGAAAAGNGAADPLAGCPTPGGTNRSPADPPRDVAARAGGPFEAAGAPADAASAAGAQPAVDLASAAHSNAATQPAAVEPPATRCDAAAQPNLAAHSPAAAPPGGSVEPNGGGPLDVAAPDAGTQPGPPAAAPAQTPAQDRQAPSPSTARLRVPVHDMSDTNNLAAAPPAGTRTGGPSRSRAYDVGRDTPAPGEPAEDDPVDAAAAAFALPAIGAETAPPPAIVEIGTAGAAASAATNRWDHAGDDAGEPLAPPAQEPTAGAAAPAGAQALVDPPRFQNGWRAEPRVATGPEADQAQGVRPADTPRASSGQTVAPTAPAPGAAAAEAPRARVRAGDTTWPSQDCALAGNGRTAPDDPVRPLPVTAPPLAGSEPDLAPSRVPSVAGAADAAAVAAREATAAAAREAAASASADPWLQAAPARDVPEGGWLEQAALAAAARPDRPGLLRSRLDRAILASGGTAIAASTTAPATGRAAVTAPATPAGDPLPEGHVTPQVVRAVLLSWRDGVGEARVRLEPESLGTLTVVLRVERGTVTATISSEVAAVRESIQAHERDLRAGLAEHGLDLDRLVVTDDRPDREGARDQDARTWRAPRRTERQSGARFEIEA